MLCSGQILAGPLPQLTALIPQNSNSRFLCGNLKSNLKWRLLAIEPDASSSFTPVDAESTDKNTAGHRLHQQGRANSHAGEDVEKRMTANSHAGDDTQNPNKGRGNNTHIRGVGSMSYSYCFCIIEGPEMEDFAKMQLQEIQDNIRSRRNKIFLHMEEVRRLRIQQRIKNAEQGILNEEHEDELPNFPSFIPFLPPLTSANLKQYYATCISLIGGIMLFGGLLAPTLELKLGLGGTSYEDFIRNMHLPLQLSQVDPIVASFSGGAVGVISALMVVEINNVKQQEHKRCKYCLGTGYLACARCSTTGALILVEPVATLNGDDQPLSPPRTERCSNCSGSGKVMCPTCLCTGMAMASEHDPRIDPFD